MKHLLFGLLIAVVFSGCYTLSRYRVSDFEGEIADAPGDGMRTRQQLTLGSGQAEAKIYVSRVNSKVKVIVEVDNLGKGSLQFNPRDAKLIGGNGTELRLINVYRINAKNSKFVPIDVGATIPIATGESQLFAYRFGTSTKSSQTEEQRTFHFSQTGLTDTKNVIPIDLDFHQIE